MAAMELELNPSASRGVRDTAGTEAHNLLFPGVGHKCGARWSALKRGCFRSAYLSRPA